MKILLWTYLENFLISLSILVPLLVVISFFTLLERKVMASLQRRIGPNIHGYYGTFQPFIDGLKLLTKELLIPAKANFYIFLFSPVFMMTLSFSLWAIIPLSFQFSIFDSKYSLLFFFVLSSFNVYNVILAGWSSNSKYAFLGSVRAIAQFLSYELVFGFAILFMLLIIGSLRIMDIVLKQYYIGFLLYPLLPFALVFFVALLMETNRAPFDLPEAESELVAGYNVEYSSIMFAMFFLGEYCNILSMSALWSILFWGGYAARYFGTGVFIFKILFFCFLFVFIRSLLPRYRLDQLLYVGWHAMLPICIGVLFFMICLFAFTYGAVASLGLFTRTPSLWSSYKMSTHNSWLAGNPFLDNKRPVQRGVEGAILNEYRWARLLRLSSIDSFLRIYKNPEFYGSWDALIKSIGETGEDAQRKSCQWSGFPFVKGMNRSGGSIKELFRDLNHGNKFFVRRAFGAIDLATETNLERINEYSELPFSFEQHLDYTLELYKARAEWFLLQAWSDFMYIPFDRLDVAYKWGDGAINGRLSRFIGSNPEKRANFMQHSASMLHALDLQLNDRIDFPDFARAIAWKHGYSHPIEMFDDFYWKSDHGLRRAQYNYVPINSANGTLWTNIESRQQRLHPINYYIDYELWNFEHIVTPRNPQLRMYT